MHLKTLTHGNIEKKKAKMFFSIFGHFKALKKQLFEYYFAFIHRTE